MMSMDEYHLLSSSWERKVSLKLKLDDIQQVQDIDSSAKINIPLKRESEIGLGEKLM